MNGRIPYFGMMEYQDELFVEDIGNCCLRCGDDNGNVFYLIISTNEVGQTRVLSFGPTVENQEFKDYDGCSCYFSRFMFSVPSIRKTIKGFINRKGTHITYAEQVSIDEIKDKFFNIAEEFLKMIGVEQ